ncbi:protein of unknown function [Bradyrhizobium vignae]|uniref:Uncharacterized protein n=1 Tax=Bradyrhizobium vignae TaxID=1549949 RepID=A0A2U3Q6U0_9BRAD|nr:protein of unknown function [Bradyrhizobium vignae]
MGLHRTRPGELSRSCQRLGGKSACTWPGWEHLNVAYARPSIFGRRKVLVWEVEPAKHASVTLARKWCRNGICADDVGRRLF